MGNWPEHIRRAKDLARFWKNTAVQGACIVWVGQRNRDGYGKFTTTVYPKIQSHHLAHRWIYQQTLGDAGEILMHSCDNPACVALHHLDKGSPSQNVLDMTTKKRGKGYFTKGHDPRRVIPTGDK